MHSFYQLDYLVNVVLNEHIPAVTTIDLGPLDSQKDILSFILQLL